ncbi:MAG: hypothetical protein N3G20_07560, partial [Verrucomicrobiae bacterium]|nr:hypothetical protein [Verrucomicrobiae bacterium]
MRPMALHKHRDTSVPGVQLSGGGKGVSGAQDQPVASTSLESRISKAAFIDVAVLAGILAVVWAYVCLLYTS